MTRLKISYFGSSLFSADLLEKLATDSSVKSLVDIIFVATQPDRPAGRKQVLTATPVSATAKQYNLECLKVDKINSYPDLKEKIQQCDLVLLYAFSQKIPQDILSLPKNGFWNIHPSLLPKYRGPSPISSPLINGDTQTGVTLIKMDKDIDHGPIITQEKIDILPFEHRSDLEKKLTHLGFRLFIQSIKKIDKIKYTQQNHSRACYTKLLKKSDGLIPFKDLKLKMNDSPKKIFNLFRGLYPWPGVWTFLPNGKRLKITSMMLENNKAVFKRVQLEGKKETEFKTFNKAYKTF